MVGAARLELAASCSQSRRASQLRHAPMLHDITRIPIRCRDLATEGWF